MEFYINESATMGYSPYDILLDETSEMNQIADEIQKRKGRLPLFDDSGEYNGEDWYNFYLECDLDGVFGMYFTYGISERGGNEIELSKEDKAKAFEAVLEAFGGYEKYKKYIEMYEGIIKSILKGGVINDHI